MPSAAQIPPGASQQRLLSTLAVLDVIHEELALMGNIPGTAKSPELPLTIKFHGFSGQRDDFLKANRAQELNLRLPRLQMFPSPIPAGSLLPEGERWKHFWGRGKRSGGRNEVPAEVTREQGQG